MKITRGDLSESDYDTLFTKDPGYFIESLIINIIYAKETGEEVKTIARQRHVFEKWLKFYTGSIREQMLGEIEKQHTVQTSVLLADAERRGRIAALANLPMKKGMWADHVDLKEVVNIMQTLSYDDNQKAAV
jgi:hypothetical protein